MNDKSKADEADLKPTVLKPTAGSSAKKTPAKKTAAKKAPAKNPAASTAAATEAVQGPATEKPAVKARKPISKAEYAKTTSQSPDSTAVIPVVKDVVKEAIKPTPGSPVKTESNAKPEAAQVAAPAVKAEPKPVEAVTKPKVAPVVIPQAPTPPVTKVSTTTAPTKSAALEETGHHQALEEETLKPPVTKTAVQTPAAEPSVVAQQPNDETKKRRKIRRKLSYIEPWSVTKMAFVISVALMIVLVVAVVVFWFVLQITGVWQALNDSIVNVLSDGSTSFDINNYVGLARITGLTLIVSAFNVVFSTALATIGAHLYNLAAGLMGGVEVTFEERNR